MFYFFGIYRNIIE